MKPNDSPRRTNPGDPLAASLVELIRERQRAEAPQRERVIAVFMTGLAAIVCALSLASGPVVGWGPALRDAALLAGGASYYAALLFALQRGWFHPAIPWINVAIEVSAPALLLFLAAQRDGPVDALSGPILAAWPVLVIASSLRANRALAYAAGALAAAELMGLYFAMLRPAFPGDYPAALNPLNTLIRAFFLLYAGIATATVARLVLRKSEEAIRALRERDVMGKYLLHERIGAGGMAEVFRATYCPEGGFQKQVALKRVLPGYAADPEFVRLFREESRLGALLIHPSIVQVLDVGSHQGSLFLAMEYVDGLSLQALLRALETPLPPAAVSWIGVQLASALDYAHNRLDERGEPLRLVHRDLNPPNVLLSRLGEVKLSDFGIARAASRVRMTATGLVRGKPQYLAPEQATLQPIDHRADLFALGLTLWEALARQPAILGPTEEAMMQAVVDVDVAPVSSVRPDVPREFEALIARLLQRDPDRRTPSASRARHELESLGGAAAPFPLGQKLLATAVFTALERRAAGGAADAPTEQLAARIEEAVTEPLRKGA